MPAGQFFIVGAQRSGTTKLAHLLDGHPRISMAKPYRPEPKVFLEPDAHTLSPRRYFDRCFPHQTLTEEGWLGEKSTSYYEHTLTAARIRSVFPRAHILFILREPVARALSNYHFSRSHGLETRTLSEVFLQGVPPPAPAFRVSVDPFDYLGRGTYLPHVQRFVSYFGRQRVHVLFLEQLIRDPAGTLSPLLDALEVEPLRSIDGSVVNATEKLEDRKIVAEIHQKFSAYFAPLNEALLNYLAVEPPGAWHY